MKVKVDIDLGGLFSLNQAVRERARLAQRRLAAAVLRDSQRYIPFRTGMLKRSGDIISNYSIVRWATKYAEYVWRMPQSIIKQVRNPHAHSEWFKHAQNLHGKEWKRLVSDTMQGKK